MRLASRSFLLVLPLLLATLACGVPSLPDADSLLATSTPELPPTPTEDMLTFQSLTYRISLEEGETVPGTGLSYIGQSNNAYQVEIDGLPALKQPGDSFTWKGVMAPGVIGQYNLRIATTFFDELLAVGPVNITILNPLPVELQNTEGINAPLHFNEIVVQYLVPVGETIPGTSLVYEGAVEQGAQLSGTQGYPYRAQGDSIIWVGQIRGNVFVRYTLRVLTIDANAMRVAGSAELWVK